MKRTILALQLLAVIGLLQILYPVQATGQNAQSDEVPTDVIEKPFTGDFDAMVKRRLIRVVTVYSKTFFFIDKGTPRGLVYDAMKKFETDLNTKLKTGNMKIHIVFIPVSRDELLPTLVEGKGDIAMANL